MTTYRVKHNRGNPYARLNKQFLESPGLSAKAKGILAYLLSRPDDFDPADLPKLVVSFDGESYYVVSGMEYLEAALVESVRNLQADYVSSVQVAVEVRPEAQLEAQLFPYSSGT